MSDIERKTEGAAMNEIARLTRELSEAKAEIVRLREALRLQQELIVMYRYNKLGGKGWPNQNQEKLVETTCRAALTESTNV